MQKEVLGTEVPDSLQPTHTSKTFNAIKAHRAVKRITFERSEASPGETLYVHVPKLNENEVLVPGSLGLWFDIDLTGGHANNFLVQNVSRVLVSKMVVKFAGTILQDTDGYDLTKYTRICSFRKSSATTWCLKESRAKICARSGPMQATRKPRASIPKTS